MAPTRVLDGDIWLPNGGLDDRAHDIGRGRAPVFWRFAALIFGVLLLAGAFLLARIVPRFGVVGRGGLFLSRIVPRFGVVNGGVVLFLHGIRGGIGGGLTAGGLL